MNLFLIGYRCTGKSSVGRSLSTRLGRPFVDTDSLLVSERGMSIKQIVDTYGWEVFRQIEHATVKLVCSMDRRVVATGGGVVLNADDVTLMQKGGRIVWLRATPETIKMLGEKEIRSMKPTSFLINIARGSIIDEDMLIRALEERCIAGAGLDTVATEPLSPNSKLWELSNVIITPHISGRREDYYDMTIALFCENLKRYIYGKQLLNTVNKKKRY